MTEAEANKTQKECFVIGHIGEDNTEARKRSDLVLKHIIAPAAIECGYTPVRADHISTPGMITTQIIKKLIQAPLVIADLTDQNPNVFYELAVRHATKKPVIQIIDLSENGIPFDVAQLRTLQFSVLNLDSAEKCRNDIIKTIHTIEASQKPADTPLSAALESILREGRTTLVTATQRHYELATALVKDAKQSIVLCQRTSSILLGAESGRTAEQLFRDALLKKIEENVQVYHLIHEDSCLADVWRMHGKFTLDIENIINRKNLHIGRYLGIKPVPRLLIIDGQVLGSVFDIDQDQFYEVVEVPEVSQAAEHAIRYVTDKGVDGFETGRLIERLRVVQKTRQQILRVVDEKEKNQFGHYITAQLSGKALGGAVLNFGIPGGNSPIIPLAWPKKKIGFFFDVDFVENQEIERQQIWSNVNQASRHGWKCFFFARNDLITGLDAVMDFIRLIVTKVAPKRSA